MPPSIVYLGIFTLGLELLLHAMAFIERLTETFFMDCSNICQIWDTLYFLAHSNDT